MLLYTFYRSFETKTLINPKTEADDVSAKKTPEMQSTLNDKFRLTMQIFSDQKSDINSS